MASGLQTLTDTIPALRDGDYRVRIDALLNLRAVIENGGLEPDVGAKYADHIVPRLADEDLGVRVYAFDVLAKVPLVALVPHRHALQALQALQCNDKVADKFRSLRGRMCSLRGRVWLVRLRQLFWCQRLVWYWGSRACGPGSRQARAAASEFGRMQGVSAEEGGEREVKRARVE